MSEHDDEIEDGIVNNDVDDSIEAQARRMGWKPREEFNGPDERWTDAETFVKKGEEVLPVLRDRMRNLDANYAKLQRDYEQKRKEDEETRQLIQDLHAQNKKDRELAEKRVRAQLERERVEAVREGNETAFEAADKRLRELEQEKHVVAPKPPVQEAPPEVTNFIRDNPWFNQDVELREFAQSLDERLMKSNPNRAVRDRLDDVAKRVKLAFPEKFQEPSRETPEQVENTRRRAPAPVAGNTAPPRQRTNQKSYDNLPADAKAVCDRMCKHIPNMTREKYCADYDWSDS